MYRIILISFLVLCYSASLRSQDLVLRNGKYTDREKGTIFTGTFKEFDQDHRLVSSMKVREGLLNDSTILYYPSGNIREVRIYSSGKKDGTWVTRSETGHKTASAGFRLGKKDGDWFVWDESGVCRYEMHYRNGEKSGTWIIRDEGGQETTRENFR